MADFRKCIPVLAVLVLLLGFSVTASAQLQPAFTCTASTGAVTPSLRSEGLTELTGDIVLNCTGGIPTANGAAVPQANIQIVLNTALTSRLIDGSSHSEAMLLIDEPSSPANPNPQLACPVGTVCGHTGTGGTSSIYNGAALNYNVWYGTQQGTNSVVFLGIPVDPPGSTGIRVFRFTNIRANASAVAPGSSGLLGQVIAQVVISGSTAIPINNPIQTVGFVQSGLVTTIRTNANDGSSATFAYQQCVTQSKALSGLLRYRENFATAFKVRGIPTPNPTQAVPGAVYNTESGFYNPALNSVAGLADFGTRLKAVFNNIPAGVSIYVSTVNVTTGPTPATGSILASLTGTEAGGFFPISSSDSIGPGSPTVPIVQLPIVSNSATAVWEITASNPNAAEDALFAVWITYTANPGSGSPGLGSATVNMSFAPTPPIFSATDGAKAQQAGGYPIPRFVDTSTATAWFSISQCVTNLLFPFVTNQAGFDTGIAISNTSQDPFGTTNQAGACTMYFYGANAPAAVTSASIAAGTSYSALASSVAPNFQGYTIAVCAFQYGHGYAFIVDKTGINFASGYLALVIPDNNGKRKIPAISLGNGSGELLGQ